MDPAAREELLDIMQDYLMEKNRTILFSTHITSDLERIADWIVYISHGEVLYCSDKNELLNQYCMVRGDVLPEEKSPYAIGFRQNAASFECLMAAEHIGGMSAGIITERATIDDVVVCFERRAKQC